MFYRIPEINYFRASTLEEALELISKLESVKVLAGGSDLLIDLKIRRYEVKNVVDISGVKELSYIEDRGDHVAIGAATKLRALERSDLIKELFPALHEAVESMAGVQIRNMGTIGGNLCNASPAADTAPPLLVFEAEVVIAGPNGRRVVPITQFFTGPGKTVMARNELLVEVRVPKPVKPTGSAFIKIARVAMDLAKVNIAVALRMNGNVVEDVKVALGSVAPTPMRAYRTEEFLKGKELTEDVMWEAAKIVRTEVKPITDIRSTAEYRREVSGVILVDALKKAMERLGR